MNMPEVRDITSDAVEYWERRRIGYNVILALIVVGYFVAGLPGSTGAISFDLAQRLFILAVIANVFYCAAYVPDVFAQASGFRDQWRSRRRWVLATGVVFASIIARQIAIDVFRGS